MDESTEERLARIEGTLNQITLTQISERISSLENHIGERISDAGHHLSVGISSLEDHMSRRIRDAKDHSDTRFSSLEDHMSRRIKDTGRISDTKIDELRRSMRNLMIGIGTAVGIVVSLVSLLV